MALLLPVIVWASPVVAGFGGGVPWSLQPDRSQSSAGTMPIVISRLVIAALQ